MYYVLLCFRELHERLLLTIVYLLSDAVTEDGEWPGGPLAPQYLTDHYSNKGKADYPHLLLLAPPIFFPSNIIATHALLFLGISTMFVF